MIGKVLWMLKTILVTCLFYYVSGIELVNLEQLYHELENNYYDLQKALQTISDEKEYISKELDEQKKKANDLEVMYVFSNSWIG